MQSTFSDEQMLHAIQQGGRQLEELMSHFYGKSGYKSLIIKLIQQRNGSIEDAEDIFQDGVRHLIMNIRNEKFRGDSSIKSYLTKICLNLWHNQFARATKLNTIKENLPASAVTESSPEKTFLYKERAELLQDVLSQIGASCKKVLGLWALSYSMKEIAKRTQFKNEQVVRKKKHQCLKKLTVLLKDRPDLVQELLAAKSN